MQYLARIARIRSYYRSLTPEANDYFAPERGRGTEALTIPSLHLGSSIAFLTTTSTMVAFINNIVAGAGIALFARWLLGTHRTLATVLLGAAGTAVLSAGFLAYQKWRFGMFELVVPAGQRQKAGGRRE